jgi:RNA polymerase sigma factor (sigma-70 family)
MAVTEPSRGSIASSTALLRRASDERLARLAGRGNARAFAALYERYYQPLYRLCLSILRSPEDAQDALQSTFARALSALGGGERAISVRPWLFRIAHNESISIVRRRRPGDALPADDLPSPRTVEAAAEERARLAALVQDIDSLPARQRSALLMRELSGLPVAEIAAALSMSSGAVKQALFEARGTLHEFAEGRAMECELVRRAISDGDRRVLRARKVRAHLRDCAGCAEFRSLIARREVDLRYLAPPLPPAAAAAVLGGLLSHGAGAHAGAAAGAPALAAAKTGASSLALKGVVGLAVTAAVGAGAAQLASHAGAKHRSTAPAHSRGSGERGTPSVSAPAPATTAGSARARAPAPHRGRAGRTNRPAPSLATVPGALVPQSPASAGAHGSGVRAHGSPARSGHSLRGKRSSQGKTKRAKPTPPPRKRSKPAEPPQAQKPGVEEPPAQTRSKAAPQPGSANASVSRT